MRISLFVVALLFSGAAFSKEASGANSKSFAECKKMMLKIAPKKDPKDVEMLCRDPYLQGSANESKEDKTRRERLIRESEAAKESALDKLAGKKSDQSAGIKECKKAVLKADPGRDPKDAEMLCRDPYLKGQPGESYEDQTRRKRLIKESEEAKEKALDKLMNPKAAKPSSPSKDAVQ